MTDDNIVITEPVPMNRGVFQGDSLSPLLFCITLYPLSIALRQTAGYLCGLPRQRIHKVTHLFYVDDLKVCAQNERFLEQTLRIISKHTNEIGMSFGLQKCAKIHLKRGKVSGVTENEEDLVDSNIIRALGEVENYSYLGIEQGHIQDVKKVKIYLADIKLNLRNSDPQNSHLAIKF